MATWDEMMAAERASANALNAANVDRAGDLAATGRGVASGGTGKDTGAGGPLPGQLAGIAGNTFGQIAGKGDPQMAMLSKFAEHIGNLTNLGRSPARDDFFQNISAQNIALKPLIDNIFRQNEAETKSKETQAATLAEQLRQTKRQGKSGSSGMLMDQTPNFGGFPTGGGLRVDQGAGGQSPFMERLRRLLERQGLEAQLAEGRAREQTASQQIKDTKNRESMNREKQWAQLNFIKRLMGVTGL